MPTTMVMPQLGQTMEEGTVNTWFKKEGEAVEKGEPLLEVMTDKVNLEVESPASGILRKIIAQADETVPVMALIGIIGEPDEPIEEILAEREGDETAGRVGEPAINLDEPPVAGFPSTINHQPSTVPDRVFISPRARRLAHENGIAMEISRRIYHMPEQFIFAARFYALCKEIGLKFTIGSDAHQLEDIGNVLVLRPFIKEMGLSGADFWMPERR